MFFIETIISVLKGIILLAVAADKCVAEYVINNPLLELHPQLLWLFIKGGHFNFIEVLICYN